MRKQNRLRKLFLRTRQPIAFSEFRRYRDHIRSIIRAAREGYYLTKFDTLTRPAQLWGELCRLGQRRRRELPHALRVNQAFVPPPSA